MSQTNKGKLSVRIGLTLFLFVTRLYTVVISANLTEQLADR